MIESGNRLHHDIYLSSDLRSLFALTGRFQKYALRSENTTEDEWIRSQQAWEEAMKRALPTKAGHH